MSMHPSFNETFRFGSADFASEADVERAGLFGPSGPLLGYIGQRALRYENDGPISTFGGAGSGKLRDMIGYNVCGTLTRAGWYAPPRMLVNDPRGELAAISVHNQIRFNKAAYCINPFGLHGLPKHRVNPWDIIDPASPTFEADLKLLIADLLPLSGNSNGEYFQLRAREWLEALIKHHLESHESKITLPALYELINAIQDPMGWADIAEKMLASLVPEVRRAAGEMADKRANAPKEYSGIMGEIFNATGFLSIPAVRECLSENGGPDFSLEVLCQKDCNVYILIPAEYMSLLAPMQRAIIGSAMLYKQRHPSAPRILFLIDEAAQLGRFDALLRAYSYGRGMGIRVWSIWQDCGQISRNYGHTALSGFLGSSQTRQFFGVRDLETARMVSAMLGTQTLEYDAVLDQAAARRNKAHIVRELIAGADPFEAGLNYAHQSRAAITRTKQARALQTPDEILNTPEDRQLLFISGLGLHPIYANKYPYFTRPEMAGAYLPNPYHPPGDSVQIATRKGPRRARVIREQVPAHLAHWPQYQSGEISYIEGYHPY